VTCHKAQGGQWKEVYIDQGFFKEDMISKEYLRWLYTALTRATDKVYFVNFNPLFFE
ncbi:MAG TPA: ATP-binding domain-containing protein, partial [Prolixibacteraceae bacterium]|nr:ATP-binding domain-containing protein [Prolixibacteraceae bacterium]